MAEPSRLVPELGAGADITYPDTQLFINGEWCDAASGGTKGGTNPATGGLIGRVAQATKADLNMPQKTAFKNGGAQLRRNGLQY